MDNWREILAGLTEAQRNKLQTIDLEVESCGYNDDCKTCEFLHMNCDAILNAELIRRAVKEEAKKYEKVVEAARAVVQRVENDFCWEQEEFDALKEAIAEVQK